MCYMKGIVEDSESLKENNKEISEIQEARKDKNCVHELVIVRT